MILFQNWYLYRGMLYAIYINVLALTAVYLYIV